MSPRYPQRERGKKALNYAEPESSATDYSISSSNSDSESNTSYRDRELSASDLHSSASESVSTTNSTTPSTISSMRSPESVSLIDVQRMLESRSPIRYADLPSLHTTIYQSRVSDNLLLLIGHTSAGHQSYLRIAHAHGRVESDLDRSHWPMVSIELVEPFKCVYSDGRLEQENDKRLLRALICYLLLLDRCMDTLEKYAGFDQDLVDAFDSIDTRTPSQNRPKRMLDATCSSSDQANMVVQRQERTLALVSLQEDVHRSLQDHQIGGDVSTKRARLDQTLTSLRRRHEEQSQIIIALGNELAGRSETLASVRTHRDELLAERRNLRKQLQKAYDLAEEEEQKANQVDQLKMEAERKLKEYIDAQKKIAAQFA
ncbi:hypothetical protein E8E11_000252 [Didymella keratinophila]|nr:hypothetical protein E8E11_000252 [Didymella keratinophila]